MPITHNSPRIPHQLWLTRLLIFAVALVPRAWLLYYRIAIIALPPRLWGHSDAADYLNIAQYFSLDHRLLAVRPPLHPLVIALVYRLGGTEVHAAGIQVIFGALTAVLAYDLARRLLPNSAALLAGLIAGLDFGTAFYTSGLNAEAIANMLFTASLLTLAAYLQERRWRAIILSAVWVSLSSLARPTTMYFWVPAALIIYLLSRRPAPSGVLASLPHADGNAVRFHRRWWQNYAVYLAICLSVILAWSARNYVHRGLFTFSTDGYFSMLFYRAVAVEYRATGLSPQEITLNYIIEIETARGNPTDGLMPHDKSKYLPPKDAFTYAIMRRLALQSFVDHPLLSLYVTLIGLGRMFAYTESAAPGIRPFEIAYNLLIYVLTVWGAWRAYRERDWVLLLVTGIPILYITGLTILAATASVDTRMRSSITALIAILAAHGLTAAWSALRQAREAAN